MNRRALPAPPSRLITYNEAHRCLGRHPRLIEPVMQILGGSVYMHQYKINAKTAFDGDFTPIEPLSGHCLAELAHGAGAAA